MGKIWLKMKGFALTTRDNTDYHGILFLTTEHTKLTERGNLTVAVERRFN